MLPIGTDKCRCTVCGLYLNSSHAFEKHRVGYPERRCRTVEELLLLGWSTNATGHWITAKRPAGSVTCGVGAAIGSKSYSGAGVSSMPLGMAVSVAG